MRGFDMTPLMRSTVGFDHINRIFDAAHKFSDVNGYPPYNIEKYGEDKYRITMAVAGFSESDVDITVKESELTVSAQSREEEKDVTYLYRGIAGRSFTRRFELADSVKVVGAEMENGLLHIDLVREVPEAKKPRTIEIRKAALPKGTSKAA